MKTDEYTTGWLRWLMVALLLCAKCFVFDALAEQPAHITWELTDYLSNAAAAAIWALPVIFTRRRWPVFVILLLADVWMIAQLVYFRANHLFLTWHLLSLAGNMEGFWSSVIPYFTLSLLLIPALTLPALVCFLWPAKRLHGFEALSILLLSAALSVGGCYAFWRNVRVYIPEEHFTWEWINPCSIPKALSADLSEQERMATNYIRYRSILAYPLYMASDAIRTASERNTPEALNEEEQAELQQLLRPVVPAHAAQGNLLILLLESFESWLIDAVDANGHPICPALHKYINTHPLLYAVDVESEIHHGMSGDGQLIVNTGLFPLLQGVACIDYDANTYPNVAHFYPHSAIVNPCRNVWNQRAITPAYGYRRLIEPDTDYRFAWSDSIVIDKLIETINALPRPSCVMGITVSGHLPFDSSPDDIPLPDSIPAIIRNYMQTAHFTDQQVGRLLAWADTASIMQNSVIAITGDHRIFHAWMNEEIRDYGVRAHLPFGTGQAGCPFLLIGQNIPSVRIAAASQMDIYPSILEAIGQNDYYWQGFGHSLLDGLAVPDEKYHMHRQMADKMIRMNYFAQYE